MHQKDTCDCLLDLIFLFLLAAIKTPGQNEMFDKNQKQFEDLLGQYNASQPIDEFLSGLVPITHKSTFIAGDINENSCKQFELLLDNWDRNEPKVYLENSRNPPKNSIFSLIEFIAFIEKLKKLNDEKTSEYNAWTSTLRAAAYSTAGGVTAGMIVADIFGCLGKCFL